MPARPGRAGRAPRATRTTGRAREGAEARAAVLAILDAALGAPGGAPGHTPEMRRFLQCKSAQQAARAVMRALGPEPHDHRARFLDGAASALAAPRSVTPPAGWLPPLP